MDVIFKKNVISYHVQIKYYFGNEANIFYIFIWQLYFVKCFSKEACTVLQEIINHFAI